MKLTLSPIKIVLLLSLLLLPDIAAVAAPRAMHRGAQEYVADEVLVKFKPGVSAQAAGIAVAAKGGSVRKSLRPDLVQVKLGKGQTVEATLAAYRGDPDVEYAQPNYFYYATAAPTDPDYGQQWGFMNTAQTIAPVAPALAVPYTTSNPPTAGGNDMNMELAWDSITDCSSVIVAVLDTGVNYNHQDLANNRWNGSAAGFPNHGYNYTSEGAANDPMDLHGHGTHVAGIIGAEANNGAGTAGVCWKASIMAVKALDSTGAGTTVSISNGIHFAVDNGAKVINMSLGGSYYDAVYSGAISYALTHDVVVVAAAGNSNVGSDNDLTPAYPCSFTHSNLLCVAALDQDYNLASFSNYGYTSVDVGAPGTNILSSWAGTSGSMSDPLDGTGINTWWFSSTTASSFGFGQSGPWGTWPALNLPGSASWPAFATYVGANTDARAWAHLDLSAYDAATLDVYGAAHVVYDFGNGSVAMAYSAIGNDPFSPINPAYFPETTPTYTDPGSVPVTSPVFSAMPTLNLNNCLTAACTVGFQFTTGAESMNLGMSVVDFTVNTLALNNITYYLAKGTSMAAPAVSGVAAMLRAHNPLYTATEVVANIRNSGRSTASLSGKTASGKAVDANNALSFINQPTGLSVAIR